MSDADLLIKLELISPLTALGSGRWRAVNTFTGHTWVTYGTEEEVFEQARLQSVIWAQKKYEKDNKIKPKRGAAWRAVIGGETRAAGRKKAAAG